MCINMFKNIYVQKFEHNMCLFMEYISFYKWNLQAVKAFSVWFLWIVNFPVYLKYSLNICIHVYLGRGIHSDVKKTNILKDILNELEKFLDIVIYMYQHLLTIL